ncbi:MAG TPA: hypothetical protein VGV40_08580, partial [Solirubrobacteraceae bacterium]|nr:hypothetical protein [Solirubrobacteraceae bacterium]
HAVLAASLAALAAFGVARVAGADAEWLGAGQLPFSVVLVLLGAAWVDLWLSEPAVGAVDATGPAAALAVAGALRTRPPRVLAVDVVLAGAGDGPALGMHAFVAARRRRVRAEDVAVLHLDPCAAGTPAWVEREGRLLPLGFHAQLRRLAAATARDETHLGAAGRVSRGESGALVARRRRWPALALGCLDGDSHPGAAVDRAALRGGIELALGVVARLDADLAEHPARGPR